MNNTENGLISVNDNVNESVKTFNEQNAKGLLIYNDWLPYDKMLEKGMTVKSLSLEAHRGEISDWSFLKIFEDFNR